MRNFLKETDEIVIRNFNPVLKIKNQKGQCKINYNDTHDDRSFNWLWNLRKNEIIKYNGSMEISEIVMFLCGELVKTEKKA